MLPLINRTPAAGATDVKKDAQIKFTIVPEEDMLPQLTWTGVTTITVDKLAGFPTPIVRLNTGALVTVPNLPLTFSPAILGAGGRDTGTESADTWYYLYLVVSGSIIVVVGSITSPALGGPTGFATWRYIGAVRNDGSSNLIALTQVGSHFTYQVAIEPTALSNTTLSTTFHDPAITGSLADVIPATALLAKLQHFLQRDGVAGNVIAQQLAVAGTAPSVFSSISQTQTVFGVARQYCEIPVLGVPKSIQYRSFRNTGSQVIQNQRVECLGWVDGFLE